MASKGMTGTVKSTQLEASIGKTIMGNYVSQMDDYIIGNLKTAEENVAMPTLDYFVQAHPRLGNRLLKLYDSLMGIVDGVELIPDEIKIAQGALFDGLCFGYDTSDDSFALYTMNFSLLGEMNINNVDMAKQCMDKNKIGQLKGYRIDVEYNQSPESFTFKAVNHRKVIDNSLEGVILVPYIASIRIMKMLESFLNTGMVLVTKQQVAGSEKVRCISKNEKILGAFCDDALAPTTVQPTFFPLKAMFYAPVLGAPSTTAMVTNINLFALSYIRKVANTTEVKKLGIEKPVDPMRTLVGESLVTSELLRRKKENSFAFMELLNSLPGSYSIITTDNAENVTATTINKYLHSISSKELEEVYKLVGVSNELTRRGQLFKGSRQMSQAELQNLRGTLKGNICKFIIRKKDCTLSSITCTNCPSILRELYGNDYFAKYEGFNVRFNALLEELSAGRDLEGALKSNGFSDDKEILDKIDAITKAGAVKNESFADALKEALAGSQGIKTRSSSSTENIMVRLCSAYIVEDGVEDYYRYIDPNKIVNAVVLS